MSANARAKAHALVTALFQQVTVGCARVVCDCPTCRRNPRFAYPVRSRNDAALIALRLALESPGNNVLCPGMSPLIRNPQLEAVVREFDAVVLAFCQRRQTRPLEEVMMSVIKAGVFGYVLSDGPITDRNLRLGADVVNFLRALERNSVAMERVWKCFLDMMNGTAVADAKQSRTPASVRAILVGCALVPYFGGEIELAVLTPLLRFLREMPAVLAGIVKSGMADSMDFFLLLVNGMQGLLTRQVRCGATASLLEGVGVLFSLLRESGEGFAKPVGSTKFVNPLVTRLVEDGKMRISHDIAVLVDAGVRVADLRKRLESEQRSQQARNVWTQVGFMGFLDPSRMMEAMILPVRVRRNRVVEDAVRAFGRLREVDLYKRILIHFEGEEAVDAGGVSREFFQLLFQQLFSPEFGMFRLVEQRFYWFTSRTFEGQEAFRVLGIIVAIAIYNSFILPIRFPQVLYKKFLRRHVGLSDLRELDPAVHSSLRQLLEMPADDLLALDMNFTCSVEEFGEVRDVPLGDSTRIVTKENVREYVELYVRFLLVDSVQASFSPFVEGINVFRQLAEGLGRFAPDEIDRLVSGEEVFNWAELKRVAKYGGGYNDRARPVLWLWEVLDELSQEEKARFLQFTTGTDRVPIGGLSGVVITIEPWGDPDHLPISHTCNLSLGLPPYRSKDELRRKLLQALTQTEGFGFK